MEEEITARYLERFIGRLSRICRLSSSLLTVLSIVAGLPFMLLPVALIDPPFISTPFSYDGSLTALVVLAIQSLLLAGTLWLLHRVFSDIANDHPFSAKQPIRFCIISILLLLHTLIELVPYDAAVISFCLGPLYLGVELLRCQPIPINFGVLLCSITFLTISAVFRYGYLLQCVSDDTI